MLRRLQSARAAADDARPVVTMAAELVAEAVPPRVRPWLQRWSGSGDTEAASRLLFSLSAEAKATDLHDQRHNCPIPGTTAACAGFWSRDGDLNISSKSQTQTDLQTRVLSDRRLR